MCRHGYLVFVCSLLGTTTGVWKPIVFNAPKLVYNEYEDKCSLYKVSFAQDLYFQYIQYKVRMPDLIQFTLCAWTKFHNHTNDHPIFSYAVKHQPRAIYSWVSNTARSSYYSMSVEGHTLYRLNYPLRLNRWYHSCQSWNGRTGEWQVWVNAERIGRGFHNRLVKHIIPGGGIPITGQEQRQYGGGFLEGHGAPPGSGGYLGEVTLLQLYSAPLAPGKAHRDHKHHHGQHQTHHSINKNPLPPPAPSPSTLTANPFLNSGQLIKELDIQSQLGRTQLGPNGVLVSAGLPQPSLISVSTYSLPIGLAPVDVSNAFLHKVFKRNENDSYSDAQNKHILNSTLDQDLVKIYNDDKGDERILLKRSGNKTQEIRIKATKRSSDDDIKLLEDNAVLLKGTPAIHGTNIEKQQTKRDILLGSPLPSLSGILSTIDHHSFSGSELSFPGFDYPFTDEKKENDKDYPREPAEGEVLQIMNACSGCAPEPFKKVEVISWRHTPKKLYSGALFIPAHQECRRF